MKRSLMALFLTLSTAAPALAQDETIGLRWREWFASMGGHVQGQGGGIPASDLDLADTLGLDDQENGHELQLYLNIPVVGRFYAGYWWIDFSGSEVLDRDVTFGDVSFTVGTTVESTLDLDMYYLTYEFGLPSIPIGGDQVSLDIGFQAGIRALLIDASIEAPSLGAEDDGAVGIPVLGVHAALQVTDFVRAEFELSGLAVSYGSTSLSYLESFFEVVGQLGPAFGGLGYKWVKFDLDDSRGDVDFSAEVRIDGLYLTVGLRF